MIAMLYFMRRMPHLARLSSGMLCLVLLTSCATLSGPREVDVPLSVLQTGLAKRFPLDQKVLEMFRLQLSEPKLTTQADSGRLLIHLGLAVSTPLTRQPWQGQLALSGRLAMDTEQNAILLRDAQIEQLDVPGMEASRDQLLGKVADFAARHILDGAVLYRFELQDLRYLGTNYRPVSIEPTDQGLRIRFEPAT